MAGALPKVRSQHGSAERTVKGAIDLAVRSVARALVEETEGVRPLPAALARCIRTADTVYHVRGNLLDVGRGAGPAIVVIVERGVPEQPTEAALRETFGLTRKQAVVAQHLALGRTNPEIAARLSISSHTARHHTEKVMAKLGVNSRDQVGAILMTALPNF